MGKSACFGCYSEVPEKSLSFKGHIHFEGMGGLVADQGSAALQKTLQGSNSEKSCVACLDSAGWLGSDGRCRLGRVGASRFSL